MLDQIALFTGNLMWGPHMLVLFFGAGLYLTIRLKGVQVRKALYSFKCIWLGIKRTDGSEKKTGDISPFQALTTSIAAAVGNGNIAGVATAVLLGGPGAVFWIWMSALIGMATKYSEVVLGVHYRKINGDGSILGGPMIYLRESFKNKKAGKLLAGFFAVALSLKCLLSVSMIQGNSISLAAQAVMGVPMWAAGLFLAVITWMVILGGIKSIARITELLSPVMSLIYLFSGLIIIFLYFSELPGVLSRIFSEAFTGSAAAGGFAGSTMRQAIRFGVARGTYSNEAGLGSGAIVHSAAKTDQPVRQGLIAMMDVFIDTLVLCSISAFAVLLTGAWLSGADSTEMTTVAFSQGLPYIGGGIVVLSSFFFGYSSLISWPYFGEQSVSYLFGSWTKKYFRWAFCFFVFLGSVVNVQTVWYIADTLNGLMTIPNLIGVLALSGVVIDLTKKYFKNINN